MQWFSNLPFAVEITEDNMDMTVLHSGEWSCVQFCPVIHGPCKSHSISVKEILYFFPRGESDFPRSLNFYRTWISRLFLWKWIHAYEEIFGCWKIVTIFRMVRILHQTWEKPHSHKNISFFLRACHGLSTFGNASSSSAPRKPMPLPKPTYLRNPQGKLESIKVLILESMTSYLGK